ncbi:hypothetical protein HOLleu_10252 [Holothuria leucospilota]|uniref:Uncharacterized protein n=1 Tax=Holothuria leucospilota TaxID=206669 RepID=A0A9Q1CCT7_HOLLE|nr:hypothetical protein HOLleu_10252 [Holothuria leucospilota]
MIRAETVAISLKTSGETKSDSLLIAMVLKGLPPKFKPFSTVITQKDKASKFNEFKVALRSFEKAEKLCNEDNDDRVMKVGLDTEVSGTTHEVNSLLVDCGATTHIINDESKFVKFDDSFNPENHFIELADGSRTNSVALGKGDAHVSLVDSSGNLQTAILF